MNNNKFIYHLNKWWWGFSVKVITEDAHGFVSIQFDDSMPKTCYVSNLSVIEESRNKGIATLLLNECEKLAKQYNRNEIRISAEKNSWVKQWYKKLGYKIYRYGKYLYDMKKEIR